MKEIHDIKEFENICDFVTHNGIAHCDDKIAAVLCGMFKFVTSKNCACDDETLRQNILRINLLTILRIGHDEVKSMIENDTDVNTMLMFDIGCGQFDHHQKDARMRSEDKIYDGRGDCKYSACSLLWNEFGYQWLSRVTGCKQEKALNRGWMVVDKVLQSIDRQDNYGPVDGYNALSSVMSYYDNVHNPIYSFVKSIENTLEFIFPIIKEAMNVIEQSGQAQSYEDISIKGVFINYDPIGKKSITNIPAAVFADTNILYMIVPSLNDAGKFNVIGIGNHTIPKLIESGKDGCTFVHATRFMAVFESLEKAKEVAFWAASLVE